MSLALIYIRQSKESEGSVSPDTQEAACRKLPAVAACERITVYRDLGISGGKPPEKRPGFLALRERILATDAKNEPLVVAAYDQSRISRSNKHSAEFFELLERRPWVEMLFHDGRFDRSPSGELTWTMLGAAATHLRKITGEKIKAAYAFKNARGIPTGPAPYGYRYVGGKRDGGVLEIDPETSPVALRIFNDYASGDHSAGTIAEALAVEQIAPPPGNKRGHWIGDTVSGMLSNVAYIGKTYAGSRRERSGDLIPATWPALIDEPLYQRVQDRLRAKRPTVANGGPRARSFTFRGLLWCSHCHRRLTAQFSHGAVYYRCGSYELPESQRCDLAKKAIREDELLPWVEKIIVGLERGRISGDWLLTTGAKVDKETAAEVVAKIDRKIKRTGDRYAEEELTKEEYRDELVRLRRQRDAYAAMAADEPDPKELATLAALWRSGDAKQRWEVLSALFERIHLENRRIIGYTPRMDRVVHVKLLIAIAFGYAADGPGAEVADGLRRGAGGI